MIDRAPSEAQGRSEIVRTPTLARTVRRFIFAAGLAGASLLGGAYFAVPAGAAPELVSIDLPAPIAPVAPEVLLPPIEVPPVAAPAVELPPLPVPAVEAPPLAPPAIDAPPVALPPVALPTVELPPVLPAVELPPVLPAVELPPIALPPVPPALELPPVPLPTVELPPVLPSIDLPAVTLPPVALPSIELPAVTLPPTLPGVGLPATPAVVLPPISIPAIDLSAAVPTVDPGAVTTGNVPTGSPAATTVGPLVADLAVPAPHVAERPAPQTKHEVVAVDRSVATATAAGPTTPHAVAPDAPTPAVTGAASRPVTTPAAPAADGGAGFASGPDASPFGSPPADGTSPLAPTVASDGATTDGGSSRRDRSGADNPLGLLPASVVLAALGAFALSRVRTPAVLERPSAVLAPRLT